MRCFLIVSAVVALATSGFAVLCPTCQGEECKNPTIPMKQCSYYHPYPLLLKSKTSLLLRTEANYACLYVEYSVDGKIQQVSQCIITTTGSDVCKQLRAKYEVKVCVLQKPQSLTVEEPKDYSDLINTTETSSNTTTSSATTATTTESVTTPSDTTSSPTTTSNKDTTTSSSTSSSTPSSTSGPTPSSTTEDGKGGAVTNKITFFVLSALVLTYWI